MVIPKINSEKAEDGCKSVDWEAKSQPFLRIMSSVSFFISK
jgi:hypothetical protein